MQVCAQQRHACGAKPFLQRRCRVPIAIERSATYERQRGSNCGKERLGGGIGRAVMPAKENVGAKVESLLNHGGLRAPFRIPHEEN
jgi:hypothetical protein